MDFKSFSNQDLHLRLEKLTRTERKITHLILWHIAEVEGRKLYFDFGYESTYSYLTRGLKYSESAAYRRIQAARLLKSSPVELATAVAEKLESGALHLSQLTQVQKCLKEESKKGATVASQKVADVLVALESKNTFESEQILAKEFNHSIKTFETTRPQKDESVRLELTLTKDQYAKLEQAKSLLSHQCPDSTWADIISALAEKLIRSKLGRSNFSQFTSKVPEAEPRIAQSNTAPEVTPHAPETTLPTPPDLSLSNSARPEAQPLLRQSQSKSKLKMLRPTLPTKVKRLVFANAQHQCEFVDSQTGHKCRSKYQLEIDHRKPLALGGDSNQENLRVLCRKHNQRAWQQSLGLT